MRRFSWLWLCLALPLALASPAWARWKAIETGRVEGLGHPESVAWDPASGRAYVSRFGPELKPAQKDGQGLISLLDAQGQLIEERALPKTGTIHKPKGLWLEQGRLWAADIDRVWVFDPQTGEGAAVDLAGARFLNDPVVAGGRLYVSDTTANRIYQIEPADFLTTPPQVELVLEQPGLAPNGLWPRPDGGLLIASSPRDRGPGPLYLLAEGDVEAQAITPPLGRLDGLAMLHDETIIYTDWATGGVYALAPGGQPRLLAEGFTGPADFALIPEGSGYRLMVPDLVKGQLRILRLEP